VLIPGGTAVGVTLHTMGGLVVGMSPFLRAANQVCPCATRASGRGQHPCVNGDVVADTIELVSMISKSIRKARRSP
jgi:hypothetical protein